jgi:hypothetical protein
MMEDGRENTTYHTSSSAKTAIGTYRQPIIDRQIAATLPKRAPPNTSFLAKEYTFEGGSVRSTINLDANRMITQDTKICGCNTSYLEIYHET